MLEGVPSWVEIRYSDGMDAMISTDGRIDAAGNVSTAGLLLMVDEAAERMRWP